MLKKASFLAAALVIGASSAAMAQSMTRESASNRPISAYSGMGGGYGVTGGGVWVGGGSAGYGTEFNGTSSGNPAPSTYAGDGYAPVQMYGSGAPVNGTSSGNPAPSTYSGAY